MSDVVDPFNKDVRALGGYAYTTNQKRSSVYANRRDSNLIIRMGRFAGKTVVDIGCGDGAYTAVLRDETDAAEILGIDPASEAIEAAVDRFLTARDRLSFQCGRARDLVENGRRFDVAILRGVLHHTTDPEREISDALELADTVLILEPNGLNPVLKMIERFSKYHIEHKERSFSVFRLRRWISRSGGRTESIVYSGLVPFFCPDWMVAILSGLEPIVQRLPLIRSIACGSIGILARSTVGGANDRKVIET